MLGKKKAMIKKEDEEGGRQLHIRVLREKNEGEQRRSM